jgi:type I restriction enzyme S subunit
VAKITPCFENGKAAQVAGLKNGIGFGSTEFHVLRAGKGLNDRFLFHLVRSPMFRDFGTASMYGAGGQKRVPTDFVADFVVPLPPAPEQDAIVQLLDEATVEIDALIEKQTEFLERLDEHRRSIVTQTVTRGLNSSVRTKPTASRLFETTPEHWDIKRLKNLAPDITVGVVVTPSKYYAEMGVPALRSLNVKPMEVIKDNLVYFDETSNRLLAKSIVRTDDLVVVRTGKPGTTAIIPSELDGANCIDLILVRHSTQFDSRFLAHVLNSDLAQAQYIEGSEGAIQQHFNVETAKNLLVPVPPIAEQRTIAQALDQQLFEVSALRERGLHLISLLQERRSAVITAALSGQIDGLRPTQSEAA